MIYFYLSNGTVNRYNLNFELENIENYGILVEKLLLNITNYIFGVQNIIITIQNDEEDIYEINLETEINLTSPIENKEKIVKFLIYERERFENGNVKPSALVDKYLAFQTIRQDQLYAQSIENENYRRRRYSLFNMPSNSRITNRIANALYTSINNTLNNDTENSNTDSSDTDSWDETTIEPIIRAPLIQETEMVELPLETSSSNVDILTNLI